MEIGTKTELVWFESYDVTFAALACAANDGICVSYKCEDHDWVSTVLDRSEHARLTPRTIELLEYDRYHGGSTV